MFMFALPYVDDVACINVVCVPFNKRLQMPF